jgi:hypothetical protein
MRYDVGVSTQVEQVKGYVVRHWWGQQNVLWSFAVGPGLLSGSGLSRSTLD